jgi:shikimate dehydrogenase
VPRDLGLSFEAVVDRAKHAGLRGVNITHPYKERVLAQVAVEHVTVRAIGACNTVLFDHPAVGLNTDYTGFIAAFRGRFGGIPPGVVGMAGCGGAGKAIAFALAALGATGMRLFDVDHQKSHALAVALGALQSQMNVHVASSVGEARETSDGLINCTPLGMIGYGGNAFDHIHLQGCSWICDAVYTPPQTNFLNEGQAAGAEILSGYELFLYQGIHAFRLFTGTDVDAVALRGELAKNATV